MTIEYKMIKKRKMRDCIKKIGNQQKLENLTFEITNNCPLRCEFCSSNAGHSEIVSFSLEEIENIVNQVSALGCKSISLSGGEPLTHPKILEISKYIKNKAMSLYIYTSGNLFYGQSIRPMDSSLISSLKALAIDKLIFNMHEGDENLYDKVTNTKGSFNNLINSIRIANKYGLKTALHFVVTKKNYNNLPKIYHIIKSFGIESIKILRFVPQGAGSTSKSSLELDANEVEEFKIIIKNLMKDSAIPIHVGAHFSVLLLGEGKICTAAIKKASILSDGYMVPCSSMKESIYKKEENEIKKHSIAWIWYKSPLFIETRLSLKKILSTACSKCLYYKVCHGGCPAQRNLYNGSIEDGPDPLCSMKEIWSYTLANSIRKDYSQKN